MECTRDPFHEFTPEDVDPNQEIINQDEPYRPRQRAQRGQKGKPAKAPPHPKRGRRGGPL